MTLTGNTILITGGARNRPWFNRKIFKEGNKVIFVADAKTLCKKHLTNFHL
jgi:short-subunit dehydrogenase involved in D-alanine esterification of teichoic acids